MRINSNNHMKYRDYCFYLEYTEADRHLCRVTEDCISFRYSFPFKTFKSKKSFDHVISMAKKFVDDLKAKEEEMKEAIKRAKEEG